MTALENRRRIVDYRIVRHGVDGAQYFPGHGLSGTKWTDTATGCADTERKALEDALDQLSQNGWDAGGIDFDQDELGDDECSAYTDCECECEYGCRKNECCCPDDVSPDEHWTGKCTMADGCDCACHDECDLHYYVSVDVRGDDD